MAHSRLEKIGTIYSRVTGLIRAGAMKLEDRPLWYEVYQMYPPEHEPKYDTPPSDKPIRSIFYPEDALRAKFHKRIGSELPAWDLTTKEESVTHKFISLCSKIESESNISSEDAFEQAIQMMREQGLLSKTKKEIKAKITSKSTPEENFSQESSTPTPTVDIKNLFNS